MLAVLESDKEVLIKNVYLCEISSKLLIMDMVSSLKK